jgi:hypothetical protein
METKEELKARLHNAAWLYANLNAKPKVSKPNWMKA